VTAGLDAAVVAIGRRVGVEGVRRRGVEEEPDLLGQRRPVVLEGQEVVGAPGPDGPGYVALAPDGIDGDGSARQLEPLQEQRDRGDLVAFGGDRLLPEDEALPRRPCGDEMERVCRPAPGAAGRLAVATMSGSPSRKLSTQAVSTRKRGPPAERS